MWGNFKSDGAANTYSNGNRNDDTDYPANPYSNNDTDYTPDPYSNVSSNSNRYAHALTFIVSRRNQAIGSVFF